MKITQKFNLEYRFEILFTEDVFAPGNQTLLKTLHTGQGPGPVKVGVVVDDGVAGCHPQLLDKVKDYMASHPDLELAGEVLTVKGGEHTKNSTEDFNRVLQLVNEAKIDRHAYLLGIGGGAVLDMVGFAAGVAHRGVRHIRIPTTVLSQNDSGVGVKNGINYFDKKNFIGTFAPPNAVINDRNFLTTLDERDWRAGVAEAIKVALIKDAEFFEWLEDKAEAISSGDLHLMEQLIYRCARLHSQHISKGNDPFERGSARPLDFGHWSAHKLEQLSNYELRHGEAVAIGIALDSVYAHLCEMIDETMRDRILKLFRAFGFDVFHALLLDEKGNSLNPDLIAGLEEFREHLGGQLTITLIDNLGHGIEVHHMQPEKITKAAQILQQKHQYAY